MNKYTIVRKIGGGGEGSAFMVKRRKDEEEFVMKQRACVTIEEANEGLSEALALARFHHDNIVQFEDIFINPTNEGGTAIYYICIVMEHCGKGNLAELLYRVIAPSDDEKIAKPSPLSLSEPVSNNEAKTRLQASKSFDEKAALTSSSPILVRADLSRTYREHRIEWILQICKGVKEIHKAKLVHRDLKSENLFMSNSNVIKIGDFGLATHMYDGKVDGAAGTYCYIAPEVLKKQAYNRSADIFSLGCIIYEIMTCVLLSMDNLSFGEQICHNMFDKDAFLAKFPEEHKELGQLALTMIDEDPLRRPTIEAVISHKVFHHLTRERSNTDVFGSFVELASEIPDALSGGMRRQLLKADIEEASELLGRAFHDDPRFVYAMGHLDAAVYTKALRGFFKMAMTRFLSSYQIWGRYNRKNKLQGVAIWLTPDNKKRLPTGQLFLSILTHSFSALPMIGLKALRRMKKLGKTVDMGYGNLEEHRCWQLVFLGVDPDCRNQNIGENLIEPVLQWANRENKRASLFTYSERSLHFFMRCGFETEKSFKEPQLPKGLGNMWIMVRRPTKSEN